MACAMEAGRRRPRRASPPSARAAARGAGDAAVVAARPALSGTVTSTPLAGAAVLRQRQPAPGGWLLPRRRAPRCGSVRNWKQLPVARRKGAAAVPAGDSGYSGRPGSARAAARAACPTETRVRRARAGLEPRALYGGGSQKPLAAAERPLARAAGRGLTMECTLSATVRRARARMKGRSGRSSASSREGIAPWGRARGSARVKASRDTDSPRAGPGVRVMVVPLVRGARRGASPRERPARGDERRALRAAARCPTQSELARSLSLSLCRVPVSLRHLLRQHRSEAQRVSTRSLCRARFAPARPDSDGL